MSEGEPEFFSDNKTHKLLLGNSFKNDSHSAFHTVRYDFKPASVDQQQEGELEVGDANEVTVSLPHIQGSKTACTVYKGSKKPAQKECVLIFDHVTGEFTLERITSQIQVKKTRDSGNANFSSNPSLGPAAPKLPKVFGGMPKKPSKAVSTSRTLNRKPEPSRKRNEDLLHSSEISHNVAKPFKITKEKSEPEKTDKQSTYSTDESHSSSSSGSSSSDDESRSSSDENDPEPPQMPKQPITSSQLHEDLELNLSILITMVRLGQILLRRGRQIVKGEDPESYRHIKYGPVKWRDYRSPFADPPYWYKWSMQSPYSPLEQKRIRGREGAGWYSYNYDKIMHTLPDHWLFHVGDKVGILAGKDKGKKGEVVKVIPQRNWVVVGGRNVKYTESNGEMVTEEQPLEHDEVTLLDPVDNEPTGIEFKADENGHLVRVSVRTGRIVQEPLELLHDRTLKCEYLDQDKDTSEKNALVRTFVPSMKSPEEELKAIYNVQDLPLRETFWY